MENVDYYYQEPRRITSTKSLHDRLLSGITNASAGPVTELRVLSFISQIARAVRAGAGVLSTTELIRTWFDPTPRGAESVDYATPMLRTMGCLLPQTRVSFAPSEDVHLIAHLAATLDARTGTLFGRQTEPDVRERCERLAAALTAQENPFGTLCYLAALGPENWEVLPIANDRPINELLAAFDESYVRAAGLMSYRAGKMKGSPNHPTLRPQSPSNESTGSNVSETGTSLGPNRGIRSSQTRRDGDPAGAAKRDREGDAGHPDGGSAKRRRDPAREDQDDETAEPNGDDDNNGSDDKGLDDGDDGDDSEVADHDDAPDADDADTTSSDGADDYDEIATAASTGLWANGTRHQRMLWKSLLPAELLDDLRRAQTANARAASVVARSERRRGTSRAAASAAGTKAAAKARKSSNRIIIRIDAFLRTLPPELNTRRTRNFTRPRDPPAAAAGRVVPPDRRPPTEQPMAAADGLYGERAGDGADGAHGADDDALDASPVPRAAASARVDNTRLPRPLALTGYECIYRILLWRDVDHAAASSRAVADGAAIAPAAAAEAPAPLIAADGGEGGAPVAAAAPNASGPDGAPRERPVGADLFTAAELRGAPWAALTAGGGHQRALEYDRAPDSDWSGSESDEDTVRKMPPSARRLYVPYHGLSLAAAAADGDALAAGALDSTVFPTLADGQPVAETTARHPLSTTIITVDPTTIVATTPGPSHDAASDQPLRLPPNPLPAIVNADEVPTHLRIPARLLFAFVRRMAAYATQGDPPDDPVGIMRRAYRIYSAARRAARHGALSRRGCDVTAVPLPCLSLWAILRMAQRVPLPHPHPFVPDPPPVPLFAVSRRAEAVVSLAVALGPLPPGPLRPTARDLLDAFAYRIGAHAKGAWTASEAVPVVLFARLHNLAAAELHTTTHTRTSNGVRYQLDRLRSLMASLHDEVKRTRADHASPEYTTALCAREALNILVPPVHTSAQAVIRAPATLSRYFVRSEALRAAGARGEVTGDAVPPPLPRRKGNRHPSSPTSGDDSDADVAPKVIRTPQVPAPAAPVALRDDTLRRTYLYPLGGGYYAHTDERRRPIEPLRVLSKSDAATATLLESVRQTLAETPVSVVTAAAADVGQAAAGAGVATPSADSRMAHNGRLSNALAALPQQLVRPAIAAKGTDASPVSTTPRDVGLQALHYKLVWLSEGGAASMEPSALRQVILGALRDIKDIVKAGR